MESLLMTGKYTQLADDTTFFLKNTKLLEETLVLLEHFKQRASFCLNKDKTEAIILGQSNNVNPY